MQTLIERKLCTPRDVRRCLSRVRRLTADLPAFDSIWLDALVQARVLTAWQARFIEAGDTDQLTIGPCIVLDRIGHGVVNETFLTELNTDDSRCIVKRIVVPAELASDTLAALKLLVERGRSVTEPHLVVPHAVSELDPETNRRRSGAAENSSGPMSSFAVVSRVASGLPLSQVVLRRGRLPGHVVIQIARQLLSALQLLHSRNLAHGEIALRNILLQPNGQTVLVDAGISPAVMPAFQINAFVDPVRNDGVAPELIGTGRAANARSDLYAAGCVLWHLLAGRCPFPTGDPLSKLASHQTERIEDIREIAPDTPAKLAEAILWLTEPNPSKRPARAADVLVDSSDAARPKKSHATTGADSKAVAASGNSGAGNSAAAKAVSDNAQQTYRSQRGNASSGASSSAATATGTVSPATGSSRAVLGRPGRSGRMTLSRFAGSFQQTNSRSSRPRRNHRFAKTMLAATAAVVIAAGAFLALDGRAGTMFLAAMRSDVSATTPPDTGSSVIETPPVMGARSGADSGTAELSHSPSNDAPGGMVSGPVPLPHPDAFGVIELSDAGPYAAGTISWAGHQLVLRGVGTSPARIMISDQPLTIHAADVAIEHVELISESMDVSSPTTRNSNRELPRTMSVIRSQTLTIRNSAFLSPLDQTVTQAAAPQAAAAAAATGVATTTGYAVQWLPVDPLDPLAGKIELLDSRLIGSHSTILLGSRGRLVRCVNSLKVGGGALLAIIENGTPVEHRFEFEACTLRDAGGLLAFGQGRSNVWQSHAVIAPVDCVFDLKRRSDGNSESLLAFVGGELVSDWARHVVIDGSRSFARTGISLASLQSPDRRQRVELDGASELQIQGLSIADFSFRSQTPTHSINDSLLRTLDVNQTSAQLPGVRLGE